MSASRTCQKSKTIAVFLFSFFIFHFSFGSLTAGPEDGHGTSSASYDTGQYYMWGAYRSTYQSLNWPQYTNHWTSWSQSGGNLSSDCNSNMMKWLLPTMAACTGHIYIDFLSSENGGIAAVDTYPLMTNICLAPGTMFDGHTMTNEPGYCHTASNTWFFIPSGAIPDGDSINEARNNAATNFAGLNGMPIVDLFHLITTNGFTDPVTGTNLFGFYGGGHPYPAGHLCMALLWLLTQGAETNVNACQLNWNGTVSSTNHCVISSPSRSGQAFTWTWHADRHSLAWDVPDATSGQTNDCRPAFTCLPILTNAFYEVFQITNAPDGMYELDIDGHFDCYTTGAILRGGYNLFSDYNNQIWKQRVEVLGRTRDQNGNDRITFEERNPATTDPAGGPSHPDGVTLRSNEGQAWIDGFRGDGLIATNATAVAGVRYYDVLINQAAQPTNHTFTVIKINQVNATSGHAGTFHLGQ